MGVLSWFKPSALVRGLSYMLVFFKFDHQDWMTESPHQHGGGFFFTVVKQANTVKNGLQLEFEPWMRFETANLYPTRQDGTLGCTKQFRYVCVCLLGGIYDVSLYFLVFFFDWCLRDTIWRSDSFEFILTSVNSQPEMECLIGTTWDWMCSPDPPHLKWRLMNCKSLPILKTSPFDWMDYDVSFKS